ncbi:MAG: T9SS type A sorting domain-containing protein [Bacteroidetes bacterium]|nr:T9SS type A sorting domain-containing protein [Bacteroidota bacterium]
MSSITSSTSCWRRRHGSRFRLLVLTLFGLGLCAMSVSAQFVLSPIRRFQHTYGNPGSLERSERAPSDNFARVCHPLDRLKDGGYIMVGSQGDYVGSQIITVRTTITGSQVGPVKQWDCAADGGRVGTDVHATTDGGFVILGSCHAYLSDGSDFHGDIAVIKADGAGNLVWKNRYFYHDFSNTCRAQAYSITQTKDNGYMVAGYVECPPGDATGYGDVLLMKLNADGTVAWHTEYSDFHNNFVANSVEQTSDGGYIVAGKLFKPGEGLDAFIMKVSKDGTPQWFKEFGRTTTDDIFYSVTVTADGGYIASGRMGDDIYIVKLLSTGAFDWAKTYAGPAGALDVGYDIKHFGTFYLVAGVADNSKAFLMRLRSDGSVDFSKAYAPPGTTSVARSVVVTDNGFAISGDVSSGNSDFYLVKTNGSGSSNCNTEDLALTVASQSNGTSVSMNYTTHSITTSSEPTSSTITMSEAQLCYTEDSRYIRDVGMGDVGYTHGFHLGTVVDGGGSISDPMTEPAVLDGHAWTSDAIWLHTAQDNVISDRTNGHLYEHEQINESPDFNLGTNYIYTLVTNHGAVASDPATLELYWSASSTDLEWPTHWSNYVSASTGALLGDLAGTAQIPSLEPGESYVAEISWTTPDVEQYGGTTPSVSFLARYVSESDPMTFQEGTNTEQNAINNNNIAWRNNVIVSADDMTPAEGAGTTATKSFVIRNTSGADAPADLTLSIPTEEADINPLFDQANVYVTLSPDLYQQWLTAQQPGVNVQDNGDGRIRITGDNASIGITLAANTEATVGIQFENINGELPFVEYYHYDVTQAGGVGGLTFELRFPAVEPGLQKVAAPAGTNRQALAGGMLDARPNPLTSSTLISYRVPVATSAQLAIYDITGNLVRVLIPGREIPAGMQTIQWDGTDATGATVGSGIYIYRLETPIGTLSRRLTIVR